MTVGRSLYEVKIIIKLQGSQYNTKVEMNNVPLGNKMHLMENGNTYKSEIHRIMKGKDNPAPTVHTKRT